MPADTTLVIPQTVLVQLADGQMAEMLLEDYVKGVLPTLAGVPTPKEALKALAIAVRSEAAASRRHARDEFDLCANTHCLVWKPANRYPDSDRAGDETADWVVTVNDRTVAAPFFEHCDGHTRNSEEAWAGRMSHSRSALCSCGYTRLYGHGVGICQRGAMAMAREGAPAEAILKHYFTGIVIAQGMVIPRVELQQSLILGRVVDGQGLPRPDFKLVIHGAAGTFDKGTTRDGRFWFSGLPSGQWDLQVKGKPVRYGSLRTDGRNTVEVQVVVPEIPPLVTRTIPLAHPMQLVGTLGYNGVPVTITDSTGKESTALSGSAPGYNPGGFAIPLPAPGPCSICFLDRRFDLEIGDTGLWVRFVNQAG